MASRPKNSIGPTSAVLTDTSTLATTSNRVTVRRYGTPRLMATSRPRLSTSSRRRRANTSATQASVNASPTHNRGKLMRLKLAMLRPDWMENSVGSSTRNASSVNSRNSRPPIMPIRISRCRPRTESPNSRRNSSSAIPAINSTSSTNTTAGISPSPNRAQKASPSACTST